jgi:hypothetical protein
MEKKPKRPKDSNQLAKSIVEQATTPKERQPTDKKVEKKK